MNLPNKKLKKVIYVYDNESYEVEDKDLENMEGNIKSLNSLAITRSYIKMSPVEWKKRKQLCTYSKTPTKELILPCDCGDTAYAHFSVFEKGTSEKMEDYLEDEMIYITCGGHDIFGLKNKLEIAWNIFRYGEFRNWGTLANKTQIKKLIVYLEDILKYWRSLEN